jgi:hypothetical protein
MSHNAVQEALMSWGVAIGFMGLFNVISALRRNGTENPVKDFQTAFKLFPSNSLSR